MIYSLYSVHSSCSAQTVDYSSCLACFYYLRVDFLLDFLRNEVFKLAAKHGELSDTSGTNMDSATASHKENSLFATESTVNDTHREFTIEVSIRSDTTDLVIKMIQVKWSLTMKSTLFSSAKSTNKPST